MVEVQLNLELIIEIVIALSALIGGGLSIYNFIHQRSKERVNLKVIPKAIYLHPNGTISSAIGIEFVRPFHTIGFAIINMSNFDVIVDEVGFELSGTDMRMVLLNPIIHDGKEFPRKLKPREAFNIHWDMKFLKKEKKKLYKITKAYASTQCGATCTGKNKVIRDLKKIGHPP